MNLSRRSFLIGSAAALAAVATPSVIKLPPPHVYSLRNVMGLDIHNKDKLTNVKLWLREIDAPRLDVMVPPHMVLRWWPPPIGYWCLTPQDVLRIECEGGEQSRLDFYCEDKIDAGEPMLVSETHLWPFNGSCEVTFYGRRLRERPRHEVDEFQLYHANMEEE